MYYQTQIIYIYAAILSISTFDIFITKVLFVAEENNLFSWKI